MWQGELAYKKEGLVLSKKEGGEWAIDHLPEEYHPLIRAAMREYSKSADSYMIRSLPNVTQTTQ
ncbi:MAG: DUF4111 domain-containing protein [Eubacteriaceae bacterium]|nr:DUF4111 domain-containing protein [Eubacteriaceae bacterium]